MPKKRAPLSRDRVLTAALSYVDKEGIDALSMRKLAAKLGVEAMSLYKHVVDKDALLTGLVDLILSEIEVPPKTVPWKKALRTRALSMRAVLRRHPWALPLMHDIQPTPARLQHQEDVLAILRAQGFSVQLAYRTFLLMDSYIYGFLTQEASWNADDPAASGAMMSAVSAYPCFAEVLVHVMGLVRSKGAVAAYDAEYEFGLELILKAVA